MIEILAAFTLKQVLLYAGGSIAGFVIAWIFKRIPNKKIADVVEGFFAWLGKWITLKASKKSRLWNKYIEPWVIDFIDNVVGAAVRGLIKGLRSDNQDT